MGIRSKIGWGVLLLVFAGSSWAQSASENVTDSKTIFEKGYIQVMGLSEEGQSQVKALRVAQVVAQRALLETLQGLHLQGKTTIKKGMLESDEIRTTVEGFLQGAVKCGETYHAEKGYGEVCMRVNLRGQGGIYEMLMPFMQNNTLWPGQPVQAVFSTTSVTKSVSAAGQMPAACPITGSIYDGLIIDVRDFEFKPALANRILTTKNEMVFGPARIAGPVLVERGCGAFTTDLNKAKAILSQWGSGCPLLLTPATVNQETDVQLSEEDTSTLLAHDQQSALLAQAKVVYLLK